MNPRLAVARDAPAEAAALVAARLGAVLAGQARATLALSGGRTPGPMFAALAADPAIAWDRVDVVQVDERVAPDGHPDRNAGSLVEHLGDVARLHLMPVTDADLDAAAHGYDVLLRRLTGGGPLDVVHLGLGDDGHTASWAPGDPVLDVADRDVALSRPYQGPVRMTLTVPAVARARHRIVLVVGAAKAAALAGYLDGDPSLPVSRLPAVDTVVVADADAASGRDPSA